MHHFSNIGSVIPVRVCRIHVETWAVAGLAGLLTGCLESPGVVAHFDNNIGRASLRGPGPLAAERPSPTIAFDDYWKSIAALDVSASLDAARGEPEIAFAKGIGLFAAGDLAAAERAFAATSSQNVDPAVALAARKMLATTLVYQQKWTALRKVCSNAGTGAEDGQALCGLERLGQAYSTLDAQAITFPQKPVSLRMRVSQVGTPTIRVRINGKEYTFWLDTGSTITVVSSDVAEEAGVLMLGTDTLHVTTFTGTAPVRPAVVRRIDIGPIVIANTPAIVMESGLMRVRASTPGVAWSNVPVDGILGWDTIRQFDMSLDYDRQTIKLQQPAALGTKGTTLQNLRWLGKPLVEVHTSDGATFHFALDTGAQVSFVNTSIAQQLGVGAGDSYVRLFGMAEGARISGRVVRLMRLEVAGKPLSLRDVVVYDPSCSGPINCDGILGSDIAQFGTIRIDATNGLFSVGE